MSNPEQLTKKKHGSTQPHGPGESHVPNGGAVEGCGNKPIAADTGAFQHREDGALEILEDHLMTDVSG